MEGVGDLLRQRHVPEGERHVSVGTWRRSQRRSGGGGVGGNTRVGCRGRRRRLLPGGGGVGRELEGGAEEAALHLLVCGALWKHQQRRVAVAQREIAVCGGQPEARVGGTAHAHHVSQHGVAASGTSVT